MQRLSLFVLLFFSFSGLPTFAQLTTVSHLIERGSVDFTLVDLTKGDFNNDGLQDVFMAMDREIWYSENRGDDFGPSHRLLFPNGTFTSSFNPISQINIADLDSDGFEDIIISLNNNNLFWAKNTGTGFFSIPMQLGFDLGREIVCADIDNDGDIDLLGQLGVYLNTDMNFISTGQSFNGRDLRYFDLEGDGDTDILAFTRNQSGADATLYTNNGFLNFEENLLQDIFVNDILYDAEAFDYDGDGDMDFAFKEDNDINIISNLGNGNFNSSITDIAPNSNLTFELEVGDFNGDGFDDILQGPDSDYSFTSSLLISQGNGSFELAFISLDIDQRNDAVLLLDDFNIDGKLDIVAFGHWYYEVSIYYQGDGLNFIDGYQALSSHSPFETQIHPELLLMDMNNDGFHSAINAVDNYHTPPVNYTLSTWDFNPNKSNYFDRGSKVFSNDENTSFPRAFNLDSDPFMDLVAGRLYFKNMGGESFELQGNILSAIGAPASTYSFYDVIDIDADGDDDVLLRRISDNSIYLSINDNGVFQEETFSFLPFGSVSSVNQIVDFNGDGFEDIILEINNNQLHYHQNNTSNGFLSWQAIDFDVRAYSITHGDVDNNGFTDMIYCEYFSDVINNEIVEFAEIRLVSNSGSTYAWPEVIAENIRAFRIASADMNGDGFDDILVNGDDLIYIESNGNGTFQEPLVLIEFDAPGGNGGIHLGDIDNDGDVDMLYSESVFDNFSWLENTSGEICGAPVVNEFTSTLPWNEFECAYDSIFFNGIFIDEIGTYLDTIISPLACESILVMHLVPPNNRPCISNPPAICTQIENIDLCYGETYTFRNNTYTAPGIFADTVFVENSCDSIFVLNLMANTNFTLIEESLCDGNGFQFNGESYFEPGNYILNSTATDGCPQQTILNLSSPYVREESYSACEGSDLTLYGTSVPAGTFDHPILIPGAAPNACDSVVIVNVNELPNDLSTDAQTACSSYTWIDGNTYFSSNNTATFTIANGAPNGCDNIIQLDLVIEDNIAPTPPANLPALIGQCELSILPLPIAVDQCDGNIAGTPSSNGPFTNSTTILWTYTDLSGNSSTQSQQVIIQDTQAPELNSPLENVSAECELVSLKAPIAMDNCDGSIIGQTTSTFPITNLGNTVIIWTFVDGTGNESSFEQVVTITDSSLPVPVLIELPTIQGECEVLSIDPPVAIDNCDGEIIGTSNISFPISTNTTIVWTFTDLSGNQSTQNQEVSTIELSNDVELLSDNTLNALQLNANYQWVDCENDFEIIEGADEQQFTPQVTGEYAVIIDDGICEVQSACFPVVIVGTEDISNSNILLFPNPSFGEVRIQSEKPIDRIEVRNTLGQLIPVNFSSREAQFEFPKYSADGIYFVSLFRGEQQYLFQIIKQ